MLLVLPTAPILAAAETKLPAEMEGRAKALFLQLRCVVCQNQSIGDSDADVAKDLREIVREQMLAGKTDGEIQSFLVARYGEFILLKPVFAWHTALLWVAPIVLLLIGALLAWRVMRKPVTVSNNEKLSQEDEAELEQILRQHDD
ncbi:MAG: cytochrome c-type biogenesis protein [Rhizobiaceae bacterium]